MAQAAGGRHATGQRGPSMAAFAYRLRIVSGLVWSASPLAAVSMIVLTLAGGLTPTATAWLQRAVLDGLVGHGRNMGHLVVLAVLLGVVGMVSALTQYGRNYVEGELRRGLTLLVPSRMFQAINAFPGMSRFESPAFADKMRMVQQLSSGTATRLVSSGLQCGQSLITAVGMFGALEVINPTLAAVMLGMAVPAVIAQVRNSRRRAGLEWQRSPSLRRQAFYGRMLSERAAAQEVRLFGLGEFMRGRMLAELRYVNEGQRALELRILSIEGSLSLLSAAITAGGTVWVVRQAVAGSLSVGDVSLFAMAAISVQNSISGAISRFADVYQSLLQFGHYVDLVSAEPDLPLAAEPAPVTPLRVGIELRDVWFRYDRTHPWVLHGVNMFIPAGQSVALIGLNGAGKSTLVKLILRFYDPVRGGIYWDGTDIRDFDPDELRARIGTVFQDYMTYDLTATENIGVGDLSRLGDADRISQAASEAGIHEKLASLPNGYDTMLSRIFTDGKNKNNPDTGVFLSGGQWQRLAIARSLMRADRDLLILDEPSSGMDAEAEHALHRRLYTIRQDRTSLLITHRLGSVRDATMIYVLAAGRIAEQGSHETLMESAGEYHRLFSMQASGYAEPEVSRAVAG